MRDSFCPLRLLATALAFFLLQRGIAQLVQCQEYMLTPDSLLIGTTCGSSETYEEVAILKNRKAIFRGKKYRRIRRDYKDGYVVDFDSVLHRTAIERMPYMANYSHIVSIYVAAFISENSAIEGVYCLFPFHAKIDCENRIELMRQISLQVDSMFGDRNYSVPTLHFRNFRLSGNAPKRHLEGSRTRN